LVMALALSMPFLADAQGGDAAIQYNLATAAKKDAYDLMKKACMALDGVAEACMAWADLAKEAGNEKDVKRALSSAVMLEPDNVEARFALAVMLLDKRDYTWAIEHLGAALPNAETDENRGLLRYSLGYALFKTGDMDEAAKELSLSRAFLPEDLRQRCDYYRALAASSQEKPFKSASLLMDVAKGPSPKWSEAAVQLLNSKSAFARKKGFSGQASASLGVNTHPSSAFLEDEEVKSASVLQSVFRGDVIFNTGEYTHGFQGSLTAYREQNWTEVGETDDMQDSLTDQVESPFAPEDFNTTLFIGQAAYVHRTWWKGLEHEILTGVDAETQYLDRPPVRVETGGGSDYVPSAIAFAVNAWALGGKIWWTIAPNPNAQFGLRLKLEGRPNYIDENRSSMRLRLRFVHTSYFLNRDIRFKFMAGGRYDRTYHNPAIIKYDRLLPETELNLRYRTPLPNITVVLGGELKYNWYLNSRGDAENSFRPTYLAPNVDAPDPEWEKEYYDVTRQDPELELNAELQIAAWKQALLAVTYKHHKRISNLDDAPVHPLLADDAVKYGYDQDVVMFEIRQGF
jgi:tetratricopeptide (TPR) repeat protein